MDGNRTKITRTHLGDISRITYGDGEDIEYSYNALGQLKAIKDSLGLTKIDRDLLGRERNITDHKGRSISYEYDDTGNRTGIRYANGKNIRYIYDDRGLLTGIEVTGIDGAAPKMNLEHSLTPKPAPSSVTATATVKATPMVYLSYDSYCRVASKTVGPAETAYTYDKCGHLASLVNKKNGTVLDSYEYSYDQAGNLVASSQKREGMPEAIGSYEYGYDEIGRLNRVVKDGSPLRSYTYDAFGNRTILDEAGAKTEYLYNKANQLMRTDTPHGTTIFEYDKRGNVIHKRTEGASKTVSVSYTYGSNNRLKQVVKNTDSKSLTARYAYNGLGMRVSRTTDAGSIDYVLDQTQMYNNLLESIQVDGQDSMSNPIESEDYTWLGNELVMADETPILSGRLGTAERLLGNAESAFMYDEFGVPEASKMSEATKINGVTGKLPLGFTGYMRDDISDTLFAQAREYMPEIGRFMGRDILKGRVEQPRSLNEYVYCHNDSIGFVDRDGMKEKNAEVINDNLRPEYKEGLNIIAEEVALKIPVKYYEIQAKVTEITYKESYEFARSLAKLERVSRNNPRFGSGTLGNMTKVYNKKSTENSTKLIKAARYATGASIALQIIDTGKNYYTSIKKGASITKCNSNLTIDILAGTVIIGSGFIPVVGPIISLASSVGYGIWGKNIKHMVNSLD